MPVRMVIWPPRAKPKVTAGFTCPPEMLAPTATATNNANPWQTAIATNPDGSRAASAVSLPVHQMYMQSYIASIKLTKSASFVCP